MKTRFLKLAAATALTAAAIGQTASAQEVTLKVHHFLPASSFAQTLFIQPWCDKIAKESNNKMKCQIYPSMQLGGSPPQLFEQARDGVADVVWTLPGYTAGRFPSVEVFEMPFMMQSPEATSKAMNLLVARVGARSFTPLRSAAVRTGLLTMWNTPSPCT